MKAYDKVSIVFSGLALRHAQVPLLTIRWTFTFLIKSRQMNIGNDLAGPYFDPEVGVRQGDPLSPLLVFFVAGFLTYYIKQLEKEDNHF